MHAHLTREELSPEIQVLVVDLLVHLLAELVADAKVFVVQEKLSPEDKCWKTEGAVVVEPCDLCTEQEIESGSPVVCSVLEHKKEKVECKESGKKTYKR